MKLILILILSAPVLTFAAPTIEVSNFVMTDPTNIQSTTAEICGSITDKVKAHNKVLILSDPGRHQGEYVANVSPNGRFCHVIRTRTGKATVEEFVRTAKVELSETIKIFSITN